MEFLVGAYTDKGIGKNKNQDSFCIRRAELPEGGEVLLAVICDGMGGGEKGELASKTCIQRFGNWFDENFLQISYYCDDDFNKLIDIWKKLTKEIHDQLNGYGINEKIKLGTTIALFFAFQDRYLTLHIGDSRVYFRGEKLIQLTNDHSLVAREIALGHLTLDQTRNHPQRNILLQCLGMGGEVNPDVSIGVIEGNSFYILCSDGFVHALTSKELEQKLIISAIQDKSSIINMLNAVICECRIRGEQDDISAILILTAETSLSKAEFIKKMVKSLQKDKKVNHIRLIETADMFHSTESL